MKGKKKQTNQGSRVHIHTYESMQNIQYKIERESTRRVNKDKKCYAIGWPTLPEKWFFSLCVTRITTHSLKSINKLQKIGHNKNYKLPVRTGTSDQPAATAFQQTVIATFQ